MENPQQMIREAATLEPPVSPLLTVVFAFFAIQSACVGAYDSKFFNLLSQGCSRVGCVPVTPNLDPQC